MQSKRGTGGAINVGNEDDDDGSVDPDFVSLLLYSILQLHTDYTDRLDFKWSITCVFANTNKQVVIFFSSYSGTSI